MKAKKKGNATITIKGKGNYTGKLTLKFNVTAGDITKLDVTVGDVKAGKNGYPKVTVLNESGKKLKAQNNYKVEFFTTDGTKVSKKDKFEAGTKLIAKITGTGNYEGEIVKEYTVN